MARKENPLVLVAVSSSCSHGAEPSSQDPRVLPYSRSMRPIRKPVKSFVRSGDSNSLTTNLSLKSYAEIYPSVPARIRQIWNSDVPFVKEKVELLKRVFESREEARMGELESRFALTPTESRIVIHIVEGGSVSGFAELSDRSPATVRTHLKSIFRKTGLTRQSELATIFLPPPVERRR